MNFEKKSGDNEANGVTSGQPVPGTGEVKPLRSAGWWVYYPKPSRSALIADPPRNHYPAFQIGEIVVLKDKPERGRRVIAVEWHRYRHEFVYIVETSRSLIFGYYPSPYWFAGQLQLKISQQD